MHAFEVRVICEFTLVENKIAKSTIEWGPTQSIRETLPEKHTRSQKKLRKKNAKKRDKHENKIRYRRKNSAGRMKMLVARTTKAIDSKTRYMWKSVTHVLNQIHGVDAFFKLFFSLPLSVWSFSVLKRMSESCVCFFLDFSLNVFIQVLCTPLPLFALQSKSWYRCSGGDNCEIKQKKAPHKHKSAVCVYCASIVRNQSW